MRLRMSSDNVHQALRARGAGVVRICLLVGFCSVVVAACLPDPPTSNLPTSPAVLDITPAPTLDIDATATVLAGALRPTPTPAGLYVVQAGDTLSDLAERFDTTVDEILAANGLTDPNELQAGQELIIPSLLEPLVGTTASPAIETTGTISVTQTP